MAVVSMRVLGHVANRSSRVDTRYRLSLVAHSLIICISLLRRVGSAVTTADAINTISRAYFIFKVV